jgi:hypothetical protein
LERLTSEAEFCRIQRSVGAQRSEIALRIVGRRTLRSDYLTSIAEFGESDHPGRLKATSRFG